MEYMPKSFILSEEQLRFKHWAYCRFPCLAPVDKPDFLDSHEEDFPCPPFDTECKFTEHPPFEAQPIEIPWKSRVDCAKAMFSQVERETEGNSLYSPVSLELALGLLSEGTDGQTLHQLQEFLGSLTYGDSVRAIMSVSKDVRIANSIWCNSRYRLKSSFLTTASRNYSALASNMDFSDGDWVAQEVNRWCSEKTNGMIPQIVSGDNISLDTILILCNAIYFDSIWSNPWGSCKDVFHCLSGREVELSDMLYSEEDYYYETDGAVAFGKLYDNGFEFIGILPDDGKVLDDIDLSDLLASKSYRYIVDAYMPKLNYEFSVGSLIDYLNFLGVTDIFDNKTSNFKRLTDGSDEVVVSSIIQKCRIELDESGTKAAAVTEIECADYGACFDFEPEQKERKVVRLNRPFYYMIVSEQAGQVFFIGKVNEV